MAPEEIVTQLQKYQVDLEGILQRFRQTRDSLFIADDDNYRLRAMVVEISDLLRDHVPGSAQHVSVIIDAYNEGITNYLQSSSYASVRYIREQLGAVITRILRNPDLFRPVSQISVAKEVTKRLDDLFNLVTKFHLIARQLRERYNRRQTLDVNDEYDVQDLMHALLRLHFDDIRPEEWAPSYAGSASRTDFLLPEINTVIEIKKTRQGLDARKIGEQLIVDIAKYKSHPQCKRLICFVYDPDGRIANPAGIEADLNNSGNGIDVTVLILPK